MGPGIATSQIHCTLRILPAGAAIGKSDTAELFTLSFLAIHYFPPTQYMDHPWELGPK